MALRWTLVHFTQVNRYFKIFYVQETYFLIGSLLISKNRCIKLWLQGGDFVSWKSLEGSWKFFKSSCDSATEKWDSLPFLY